MDNKFKKNDVFCIFMNIIFHSGHLNILSVMKIKSEPITFPEAHVEQYYDIILSE